MSIGLMLEVMDHAPAELTSGERLVLLVIAERANEESRIAKQSERWTLDVIAHRAGVRRSGLKSIFQGLARKGCEIRIPVKFDKSRSPVFAFEGTAMTFKIPHLAQRGGQDIPSQRRGHDIPSSDAEGMPQHPRGVAVASERGGQDHPQSLKTLKEPSNPSPLPPVDTDEPSDVGTEKEGKGEIDFDEQRINTLVAEILNLRPNDRRWNHKTVRAAIDTSLTDGKPYFEIERAFPVCAADPETNAPGRLPLDFYWWALPEDENCPRCRGTATVPGRDQWDNVVQHRCPDCTVEPEVNDTRCVKHPHQRAAACGLCRADRLAAGTERPVDRQPRSGQREGRRPLRNSHDNVEGYLDDIFTSGNRKERRPSTGTQRFQQAMDVAAELDATFSAGPPISEAEIARRRARGEHVPYFDPADQSVYDKPFRPEQEKAS